MAIRTILYDLDGTLLDAFTTIHRAYSHTLPLFGAPAPTMEQVRGVVGGGGDRALAQFLPDHQLCAAMKVLVAYTKRIMLEDVRLMPGGLEIVKGTHALGATLAVFTNKGGDVARPCCEHLGVTPYMAGVFGSGDTPWVKPQPEFAAHVLTKINAKPATTLLVGDSPWDVDAAHNGGFPCWCVTTGTHNAEELAEAKADRVFPDLVAMRSALEAEVRG
jgi:HAD superfamily hydrolase (TIGR01509 family)